jgi:hypothetical protein
MHSEASTASNSPEVAEGGEQAACMWVGRSRKGKKQVSSGSIKAANIGN